MSVATWADIAGLEDLALLNSPVHRLDARVKVVVTLAFVVVVMSLPSDAVSPLIPFLLYPVGMIGVGGLPVGPILRRMLVALPFALVVGLPNPLLDHAPGAAVGPIVLSHGWLTFIVILCRFGLTVGAALILVSCTGMYRIGAALGQLGVPRLFVVQLLLLFRYLAVLCEEAIRMLDGFRLRAGGTERPAFRTYASMVGNLLLRAMDRAQRIHRAMLARGFDGTIHVLHRRPFKLVDASFLVGCLLLFAIARRWNLADALGHLTTGGMP